MMSVFESVVKLNKADVDGNFVNIYVYSSPYGGYLSQRTYAPNSDKELTRATLLMTAEECRSLAKALEATAMLLE